MKVIGRVVLQKLEKGEGLAALQDEKALLALMDTCLTKPSERELFELKSNDNQDTKTPVKSPPKSKAAQVTSEVVGGTTSEQVEPSPIESQQPPEKLGEGMLDQQDLMRDFNL